MTLGGKIVAAMCGATLVTGTAAAMTSQLRDAEVIWVGGNSLVVRQGDAANDYTVTGAANLTADGAPASLSTLRPGMKVTGSLDGAQPVAMSLVDLHGALVKYKLNGNLIVGGEVPDENLRFSGGDTSDRAVLIYRSGQLVPFNALIAGDRISATVVTPAPPQKMSSADLEKFIEDERHKPAPIRSVANTPKVNRFAANIVRQAEPPATEAAATASADSASPPAAASPKSRAHATEKQPKTLPKTGTTWPAVIALAGIGLIALGATLTLRRLFGGTV
jgi:LPXTG-motif cell wall-anchored protein